MRWVSYFLKVIALACWGMLPFLMLAKGKLAALLAPKFQVLALAGGGVLLLIALIFALFGHPGLRSRELECEHHHEESGLPQILALIVVILPVFIIDDVTGGYSAIVWKNRGTIGSDMFAQAPARRETTGNVSDEYSEFVEVADGEIASTMSDDPASEDEIISAKQWFENLEPDENGYYTLNTLDLVYARDDPGMREVLDGVPVKMTGQFYAEADRSWLVRMLMVCCAADARPTAVTLQAENADVYGDAENMGWLEVRGEADFVASESGEGLFEATVRVRDTRQVTMPSDPFIFY